jgi:hypothetical protein
MIMILIIDSLMPTLRLDGQLSATCLFSSPPHMYEADHVVLGRPAVVCAILRNTYEAPTIRRALSWCIGICVSANDGASITLPRWMGPGPQPSLPVRLGFPVPIGNPALVICRSAECRVRPSVWIRMGLG